MIKLTSSRFFQPVRSSFFRIALLIFATLPNGGFTDAVMSTTAGGYPASLAAMSYQSFYPGYYGGSRGFGGYPTSYFYPSPYMYGYGTPSYYLKDADAVEKGPSTGQCRNWDLKHHKEEGASTGNSEVQKGKPSGDQAAPSTLHQARQAVLTPTIPVPLIPLTSSLRAYSLSPAPTIPYSHSLPDLNAMSRSLPTLIPVVLPLLNQATGQMLARQSFPGFLSSSSSGGGMMQQQQQQQQQQSYSGGYSSGMPTYYGGVLGGYRPTYYSRSSSKSNLDNNPISNLFSEFARAIPALY